jgi:excisionase family DNA binding protein
MMLNERDAAKLLNCSVGLMRKWRLHGGGPAYHRLGRLVRYTETDLLAYIESNRVAGSAGR